ncbi:hypothetical protein KZX46_13855 [Polymorphobacter sp. PAMC 29334]|uniref:GspH/FimT family protein n=1 Tax=Polymorphobacter sp. PAMC 29334 TaxID=2862331 RepID=UPI001C756152|nr:hypothetical protein [Polymorphobacter sp. PAMC 29334]QYE33903.1 hypothetical protein KZX46_13855 [Polymorphobacter sp. PAMC 29334]
MRPAAPAKRAMLATGSPVIGEGESGQTLLEMLVVVGILGLVVGLMFPAMIAPLRRAEFDRSRSALFDDLRRARAVAVRGGVPVSLSLSDDGRGYSWNGVPVVLPLRVRIGGDPSVVFYGDGSSTGGALAVASATRRASVRVDAAGIATAS